MRKCSKPEKYFYLIMNKPKGYVCSAVSDSHKTVYELLTVELQGMVSGAPRGCRLHTVGRLDCNTSGLLLITNDGKFSNQITAGKIRNETGAEKTVSKTYLATLKTPVSTEQQKSYIKQAATGLTLPPEKKYSEQKALPATLIFESSEVCKITVTEGKFHEIRRIFKALGNEVILLKRIAIGALTLPDDLKDGEWRELTETEKNAVSQTCFSIP